MNTGFAFKVAIAFTAAALPFCALANDPDVPVLSFANPYLNIHIRHDEVIPKNEFRPFFDTYTFSTIEHGYLDFELNDYGLRSQYVDFGGANLYLMSGNTENGIFPTTLTLVANMPPDLYSIHYSTGRLAPGTYIFQPYGISGYNGTRYGGGISISAVPEPETYAMMLAGLGALGFIGRRHHQKPLNIE